MRKFIEGFAKEYNFDLTDAFAVNEIEENDVIKYYIKNQVKETDATLYLVEDIGSGNEAVEFEDFDSALEHFIDNVIDDFKKGDDFALSADDKEIATYNDDSYKYVKEVMQFLYKLFDQLEDEEYQEEYKTLSPFAKILSDYQVSAYKVSKVTKIAQTTLSEWTRNNVDYLLVNAGHIYNVSKFFNLSVEEFLKKMGAI